MFIFALLVFRVHQHLDFALTSSTFRQLELVTVIVVKLTIVGATVARTMLVVQMLLEQLCWSATTFFF
jgi:hypothetical protein